MIRQSVLHIRCQNAVAWLDRKSYQERRVWLCEIYCEEQVALDTASDEKDVDVDLGN